MNMSVRLVPENLSDLAYRLIEEQIVTLRLPPGSRTTEHEICRAVGLGRTPVREALLKLAGGFLIQVVNRRGVLIRPIEIGIILMTLEVRRSIEGLLVRHAAIHADEHHRQEFLSLANRIERCASAHDVFDFMRIDAEFNDLVGRAARHDVAARTIAPLHPVNRRLGFVHAGQNGSGLEDTGHAHACIMRAIAAGDLPACDRAVEELLEAAVAIAHRVLGEQEPAR